MSFYFFLDFCLFSDLRFGFDMIDILREKEKNNMFGM